MAKNTMIPQTCEYCGKDFLARRDLLVIGNGRYCSRSCVNRDRAKKKLGERWITSEGYIRILSHNGRSLLEHRSVVEKAIGRPLLSSEIVHHINKDKTDNRIENLQVMTQADHMSLHHKGRKIARWSRKYDACVSCGTASIAHQAGGKCIACYSRSYRARRVSV